jgi:8-oxo-dGTP diphosphatase
MEKRITFAVKGLIVKQNKFLIVKRSHPDKAIWELPGGHLEFGETAEETIIREIKEETGLVVNSVKLLDTWNHHMPSWQITGLIYQCTTPNYEISLSDEHCEYKWIEANGDKFSLLHPVFRERMIHWDWSKFA